MVEIEGIDTPSPYLSLPEPFTHDYRLSLLEEDDLQSITYILSDSTISLFLANVPRPYTIDDAYEWYKTQPSNNEFKHLGEKSEQGEKILLNRFPFSVIRDVKTGQLVGYFSIRRNEWEWMEGVNPEGRKRLRYENDAKVTGDENIRYSIGYYLSLRVASKGLMTAVTGTALAYAKQHMNAKYVQGIFRYDNIGSKRVMEKNGFEFVCEVEMPVRGGELQLQKVYEKVL